jgi:2-succinyl-5-enolpyruvyl-6-hydroxy-3-cyclohexene-1-carboxylate synthase
MSKYYTNEKNAQVIIALLKANGIKKVIVSPGATNVTFVGSLQQDPFFEMYSAVDERSAAYMACGMAAESGEPVVLSCTGATASRNYIPGLTEAYYRKLPVLAITSTQNIAKVGHHIAQVIDRSTIQNDVAKCSVQLPIVSSDEDIWECEVKVNQALIELNRRGGGPVHINLPTQGSSEYDVKVLPNYRVITHYTLQDNWPDLPKCKLAVFAGSHKDFTDVETFAIDAFCASNNAIVLCDHTSGYKGQYRVQHSLLSCQRLLTDNALRPDLTIHIGEITGDYYVPTLIGKTVWRVSEDGEIRDTFKKLSSVFESPESDFFSRYANPENEINSSYYSAFKERLSQLSVQLPEVPFSNIWLASKMASRIPDNSLIHFAILNSLRAWNFFELPNTVSSASNVGGFGIDGCVSSLIGASLINRDKLCFGVIGDLAFFYDLNSVGNRHLGNNLRILLVNNGKGTEFRNSSHAASLFGDEADMYIAAAGHFGNKSPELIKHYAEDIGFEYLTASTKEEFEGIYKRFLEPTLTPKPMLFEVFTDSQDESDALELVSAIEKDTSLVLKDYAKQIVGEKGKKMFNKLRGK